MKGLMATGVAVVVLAGVAGGCKTAPVETVPVMQGPYKALSHGAGLEESDTLVLMDAGLQGSLSVERQEASRTADGRIIAVANVRNTSTRENHIQVQTVFRSASNISSGDETAWQTMLLQPNATETYSATALNGNSDHYTIRVRHAR
jgi:hypothetical protein